MSLVPMIDQPLCWQVTSEAKDQECESEKGCCFPTLSVDGLYQTTETYLPTTDLNRTYERSDSCYLSLCSQLC